MSKCKHAIVSGGDYVPYGSSGAYLPETIECDNPAVSENELENISCGENCQYYVAIIQLEKEDGLQNNDLHDFYETHKFRAKIVETNDFLKSKGLI